MSHRARLRAVGSLIAFAALLVTWALAIGRYGGPDEPAHVLRAAAVADGQVRGDPVTGMASGFRLVRVPTSLATGDPACYRHDPARSAACAVARPATGTTTVATAAGINPPWYYAMVGLVVRLLGHPADTTWYRLVAVGWNLLALALVGLRLRSSGASPSTWLSVAAVITPATWFLFGVVNPNGLEIALVMLMWVSLLPLLRPADSGTSPPPGPAERVLGAIRLGHRDESRPEAASLTLARPRRVADCLWVAIPGASAVLIRPIAVLPVVAAAGVLAVHTSLLRGWRWRERLSLVVPIGLAAVATSAWNAWARVTIDDPRAAAVESRWRALRSAVGGLGDTAREMVGSLGWAEHSAPPSVQFAWWLGAAALLWAALRRRSARHRVAVATWLAVLALGPVAFETTTAERIGHIWQGRYSIPALVGLAALAALPRPPSDPTIDPTAVARSWWWVLAAAELGTFWTVLRRSTVGTSGSWWFAAPADGDRWQPPLPAPVLLVTHALLASALVWFVIGARRRAPRAAQTM